MPVQKNEWEFFHGIFFLGTPSQIMAIQRGKNEQNMNLQKLGLLGGGNSKILGIFTPIPGEMIQLFGISFINRKMGRPDFQKKVLGMSGRKLGSKVSKWDFSP